MAAGAPSPSAKRSMPLTLAFHEVTYTVKLKKKLNGATHKTILTGISGVCTPGQLLAIMGPSGAGKTSLLDILAGRVLSEGQISLGSKRRCTSSDITRRAAYVQQDDAIIETQTVREALQMAADLTLPAGTNVSTRREKTEALLKAFHLEGCAETYSGRPELERHHWVALPALFACPHPPVHRSPHPLVSCRCRCACTCAPAWSALPLA